MQGRVLKEGKGRVYELVTHRPDCPNLPIIRRNKSLEIQLISRLVYLSSNIIERSREHVGHDGRGKDSLGDHIRFEHLFWRSGRGGNTHSFLDKFGA